MEETSPKQPQLAIQKQEQNNQQPQEEQANVAQGQGQGVPKMPRKRTAKLQARMLEALEQQGGHISNASKLVGINRHRHAVWVANYPKYAEKAEEIADKRLDNAQLVLDTSVMDYKNKPELAVKSAMFTLEHLGARIGYQKPGTNVQVNTQVNTGPSITLEQFREMARKALIPARDG